MFSKNMNADRVYQTTLKELNEQRVSQQDMSYWRVIRLPKGIEIC